MVALRRRRQMQEQTRLTGRPLCRRWPWSWEFIAMCCGNSVPVCSRRPAAAAAAGLLLSVLRA